MFFWGPVVGKMTDEFGPRIPILLGSFLHVFGLMMTSISKEYYQILLSQSFCSAIGCSFLFYAPIAAVGTWFLRHRAIAFGIVTAGSSLGGVVLPIMVNHLVVSIGFGWAMRSVAFLFLGLLAIANITIKSRLPPPRRKFDPKDFVTPFKEMPFLFLTISAFLLYLGSFLPFNFIIVQAKALGVSPKLAEYMVPIVNAASTFGRLLPAYLGDRVGVFNVMIPLTLLGGIFTLTVWLTAHSTASVIAYAALYGFTSGCTLSIIPAMVASFSDVRSIGTRNGSLYGVSAFGVLVGSPIAGAIVSDQGDNTLTTYNHQNTTPSVWRGYVNSNFPIFSKSILVDSGAVFEGLVKRDFNPSSVAAWSIMYQGAIPVTVYVNECAIIVGYDYFAPELRTRVIMDFFNIQAK
ncbi:hypothetical protein FPOA_00075 [Fusarium poae]|uniref:Major facilitator superfamily (MFS) profile domain-containing protein n=1 Tax=Fusarium poae TaxID=36050 RepID=A0A1B8B0A3_FUSPO|nr:hypothetical protein FPOA_00075 [Fusarium poae]